MSEDTGAITTSFRQLYTTLRWRAEPRPELTRKFISLEVYMYYIVRNGTYSYACILLIKYTVNLFTSEIR